LSGIGKPVHTFSCRHSPSGKSESSFSGADSRCCSSGDSPLPASPRRFSSEFIFRRQGDGNDAPARFGRVANQIKTHFSQAQAAARRTPGNLGKSFFPNLAAGRRRCSACSKLEEKVNGILCFAWPPQKPRSRHNAAICPARARDFVMVKKPSPARIRAQSFAAGNTTRRTRRSNPPHRAMVLTQSRHNFTPAPRTCFERVEVGHKCPWRFRMHAPSQAGGVAADVSRL